MMVSYKKIIALSGLFFLLFSCSSSNSSSEKISSSNDSEKRKPNFIIIFTDDQGYQDLSCYGSPDINTPNLDRMAEEGIKFTSFYAQTICGPSRASLMTGSYPSRIATKNNVSIEYENHPRMHDQEITIAEVLKDVGYTTAAFGKWDLAGHTHTEYDPELMPNHQGFDYFFGTSTSNDAFVNLLRNEELIEKEADLSTITRRYTDETIKFINENRKKPFFIYLAHSMPHIKLAASEQFRGKSARGLYGDVVEEIDWNVGRLLKTLKTLDLDESTYVIFTSDNGPWHLMGSLAGHGGSAEPLRGSKTSVWEGGLRVPAIIRAPGKVPQGIVTDEVASTMDFMPTLAHLAGASIPDDRSIDGHNISALIHGEEGAKSPTEAFYYYQRTHLRAVRMGKWKLHLAHPADTVWGVYHVAKENHVDIEKPMLFNLDKDISERYDVADKHPDVVAQILEEAEKARKDIGDYGLTGTGQRFFDK
jgi:arylsulfatase A-like enzyme